jgi:peptide/nickel transport system ATP-binding protein
MRNIREMMQCHKQWNNPSLLLVVECLCKAYPVTGWFARQKVSVAALDQVSLSLREGSTLGLVGESGAGKSTFARCLALLEKPCRGEIWLKGKNLLTLPKAEARRARQQIQLIFQDPATALNPRLKAVDIVAEPLAIQGNGTRQARRVQALRLMDDVGLSSQWGNRLPLEFSGGQRQRLALARALALRPRILILDEVFSGLDPPLQAQVARLLTQVKKEWGLTYLLISHDLCLVRRIADEVAVLHRGRLVEQGSPEKLLSAPEHPHTRALVSATLTLAW